MKRKKLISMLLSLVFLLGLLPAASGFAATAPDSLDAIDFAAIAGAELDESVNAYPLVNEALDLPSALSDGTAISWSSNNANAILLVNSKGYPMPQAYDIIFELTAAADSATKKFPVRLAKPDGYTPDYIINEDFESTEVTAEGNMPDTAINGIKVWQKASSYKGASYAFTGVDFENGTSGNKVMRSQVFAKVAGGSGDASIMFNFPGSTTDRVVLEYKSVANANYANNWGLPNNGNNIESPQLFRAQQGATATVLQTVEDQDVKIPVFSDKLNSIRVVADTANNELDFYREDITYMSAHEPKTRNITFKRMMFGYTNDVVGKLLLDDVKMYLDPISGIKRELAQIDTSSFENITRNLKLPNEINGINLTWHSSNPAVITDAGEITRPPLGGSIAEVSLYAVGEQDGIKTFISPFKATVLPETEASKYLSQIDIDAAVAPQPTDNITSHFQLPEQVSGYAIEWESSDPDIISIENKYYAKVIRPSEKTDIDLTATIYLDGIPGSRVFPLSVQAKNADDALSIDLSEIANQDINALETDFALPSELPDGTPLIWKTQNPEVVFISSSNMALLARRETALTARITALADKGSYYLSQTFDVNLKPTIFEPVMLVDNNFDSVADGDIPDEGLLQDEQTPVWARDTNQGMAFIGAVKDPDYPERGQVMLSSNDDGKTGSSLLHLNFDSSPYGVTVLEYDFRAEYSTTHAHMWPTGTHTSVLVDSYTIVRMPTKKGTVVLQPSTISSSNINISYPLVDADNNPWDYHTVKFVANASNKTFQFWLDGVQRSVTVNGQTYWDIPGNASMTYLAHMQFGGNPDAIGSMYIDNVKVWSEPFPTVESYADSIDLGDIDHVAQNLDLLTETNIGDAPVEWVSSNPDIIRPDGNGLGIVTRPASNQPDAKVTLGAFVMSGDIRVYREYEVTVLRERNDQESVEIDKEALTLDTTGLLLADRIELPVAGNTGTEITWSSDRPDLIDTSKIYSETDENTGKEHYYVDVTRPEWNDRKIEDCKLTATISRGTERDTKAFQYRIPEMNYSLEALASGSSQSGSKRFEFAIDNDLNTSWAETDENIKEPYLIIDFQKIANINMLHLSGLIGAPELSYSIDGVNFKRLASASQGDVKLELDQQYAMRYLKLQWSQRLTAGVSEVSAYNISSDKQDAEYDAKTALNAIRTKLANLTSDVTLPTTGERGSVLTWVSSNPSVLSNTGNFTKPSSSTNGTLTVTAVKNGESVSLSQAFYAPGAGGSGGSSGGGGGGSYPGSSTGNISGGIVSGVTPDETDPEPGPDTFNDINDAAWAADYIKAFASLGYIDGVGNHNFEPNRTITREEFLKLLMNALELSTTEKADIHFSDVPDSAWYYDYVAAAVGLGIVKGQSETIFGSGEPITRQDMCVMTAKAAEIKAITLTSSTVDFADKADIAPYASDSVSALYGSGILSGYEDSTFRPLGNSTRAEAVAVLYRLKH